MRIFHLSDLHIGLRLYNYDLRQEQQDLLRQVVEQAQRYCPDVVVIAGDIYDKSVPSAEAVQLLNTFLTDLYDNVPNLTIMLVSGNHDSAQRIDCFRSLLARQRIHLVGMPPRTPEESIQKVVVEDEFGVVNFYLLPFVKPSMVRGVFADTDMDGQEERELGGMSYDEALHRLMEREEMSLNQRNILVSHQFYVPAGAKPEDVQRMDSEVLTVGNVDAVGADLLIPFDYAALGHIHKPMKVEKDCWRYCGTPMPYSLSEEGQEKGIVMVDVKKKGEPLEITTIPLTPRRTVQKLKGTLEQLLKTPSDNYVSLTLTDKEDWNPVDMQEKLHLAFPHLLEITREVKFRGTPGEEFLEEIGEPEPYALFCEFCPDMSEEDKVLIQDVINKVREENL